MKWIFILPLFVAANAIGQAKKAPAKAVVNQAVTPEKMNGNDSLSYALAVLVADFYKGQGMDTVNSVMIKMAFDDVYGGKTLMINPEQANMTVQQKMQEYMTRKADKVKQEGKAFLDANKNKPGVVTLPSGLQYEIITKGTGPIPKENDNIKAHYIGTFVDGKEFENSYDRGQPIDITPNAVIAGWTEALQLMPVGSKWKIFIPSELAYGDRGKGAIPGGAALIFVLELVAIN